MKAIKSITLVLVLGLLTGCASVMNGPKQKVHFTSEPTEALVTVHSNRTNMEDLIFTTPAVKELDREGEYSVTFKKKGFKNYHHEIKRGINLLLFGNAVIGGIIGIVVDMSTGAAYKLTPNKIHARLEKEEVKHVQLPISSNIR